VKDIAAGIFNDLRDLSDIADNLPFADEFATSAPFGNTSPSPS